MPGLWNALLRLVGVDNFVYFWSSFISRQSPFFLMFQTCVRESSILASSQHPMSSGIRDRVRGKVGRCRQAKAGRHQV